MALGVTVAELRRYLDQVPATEADEARLAQMLSEAEQVVEDALYPVVFGAYAAPATQDIPASPWQMTYLALPPHQAGSVTAVVEVLNRGGGETTTTLSDYATADHGRLYRARGWKPEAHYRVTAVWGAGPAPESMRHVAYVLTVNNWRARDRGFFTEATGDVGGGGVRFTGGLPRELRAAIARAQRAVLGVSV